MGSKTNLRGYEPHESDLEDEDIRKPSKQFVTKVDKYEI